MSINKKQILAISVTQFLHMRTYSSNSYHDMLSVYIYVHTYMFDIISIITYLQYYILSLYSCAIS